MIGVLASFRTKAFCKLIADECWLGSQLNLAEKLYPAFGTGQKRDSASGLPFCSVLISGRKGARDDQARGSGCTQEDWSKFSR
jgi:hypothetical protein